MTEDKFTVNKIRTLEALKIPMGIAELAFELNLSISAARFQVTFLLRTQHLKFHSKSNNGLASFCKYITVNPIFNHKNMSVSKESKGKKIKGEGYHYFMNDKEHYAKMNASKTQAKTRHYISGSILNGVF